MAIVFTAATGVNVRAALPVAKGSPCAPYWAASEASPALPQRLVGSTVVQNRIPALSASPGGVLGCGPELELASQRTSIAIRKLSFAATDVVRQVDQHIGRGF